MERLIIIVMLFTVLILFLVVDKGVRKWLNIEKKTNTSRYVNRFHLMGSIAFVALFVFILIQSSDDTGDFLTKEQLYPMIGLLLGSQLFDGYMHWRYHENPKEYIITFIFLGIIIVGVFVLLVVKKTLDKAI